MILIHISGVFAAAVHIVIGIILEATVYRDKIKRLMMCIIAGIAGGAIVGGVAEYFGANELINAALEIVIITLLICRFYHIGYRKVLFISIFYEIAIRLGQFLTGAILAIATLDGQYMDIATYKGQIAVWVIVVIVLVFAMVVYCKKEETKVSNRPLIYAVIVLFFGIVTVGCQDRIEIPQDDILMWTGFAAGLLAGIMVFNMRNQIELEKKLAEYNAEQKELIEKDYTELNNAYAMNAKLFHDFHNHIGMLRMLVSAEKYKETIEYLDELQAPVKELTDSKWTGDDTIDYLINTKIATANEYDTDIQVQVEYPRHANIKSVDMCAIVGNLLDNAIEASKQVSNADRRCVKLVIRRINQMLVIKVENNYEAELRKENGQLRTTKNEGGIHGWGIKSVRAAVEKYEGSVQITQENMVFRVVATLSFSSIE